MGRKTKLIIFAIIIILATLIFKFRSLLFNKENLISTIETLGIWGPIILITLIIIQGILSVFPVTLLFFAAGILYGGTFGSLYSIIGYTSGALLTFHLGKKYGRDIEKKWITKKKTEHFEKILKKKGSLAVFLGRMLIVFPADTVSFAAGITRIETKKFIAATILGILPGILLITFLGTKFTSYLTNKWTLITIGIIFLVIIIAHKSHHKIARKIHHEKQK